MPKSIKVPFGYNYHIFFLTLCNFEDYLVRKYLLIVISSESIPSNTKAKFKYHKTTIKRSITT
jgi:hypothetical protein